TTMVSIFKRTDWKMFAAIALLICAGLASLLSSSPDSFYRQLVWIGIGAACMLLFLSVDLRSFFSSKHFAYAAYAAVNLLLLATLFLAPEIKGNRAWIVIGSFQLQPAEFAKIALILLLAVFFSRRHIGIARFKTLAISFFYAAVPAG